MKLTRNMLYALRQVSEGRSPWCGGNGGWSNVIDGLFRRKLLTTAGKFNEKYELTEEGRKVLEANP